MMSVETVGYCHEVQKIMKDKSCRPNTLHVVQNFAEQIKETYPD